MSQSDENDIIYPEKMNDSDLSTISNGVTEVAKSWLSNPAMSLANSLIKTTGQTIQNCISVNQTEKTKRLSISSGSQEKISEIKEKGKSLRRVIDRKFEERGVIVNSLGSMLQKEEDLQNFEKLVDGLVEIANNNPMR